MMSPQKRIIFSIAAICSAIAGVTPSFAQLSTDSDEPIEITGDTFEAFREKDYVIWTGDVQVVQGPVVLTAPKLTIYGIEDGEMDRIDAVGGVRYTNATEAISSEKAVYQAGSDTVVFTGNVVVVQEEQVLSGGRLVYQINTGEIKFTAQKGNRVRGIFTNDEKKSGT